MKLVILDRDGTLNKARGDDVASADEWESLPGAMEAVARLNQGGWSVVLATMQTGLGRGTFDLEALNRIHTKMHRHLARAGARIEAIFFCPHADDETCTCRKPLPGLFLDICDRFGADPAHVITAGNSLRHVQASLAAGCQTHWIKGTSPLLPTLPETALTHTDLDHFVDNLLAQQT